MVINGYIPEYFLVTNNKRGMSPTAMKFFLTKFVRGVPPHFKAFFILFLMQEKNLKKKIVSPAIKAFES